MKNWVKPFSILLIACLGIIVYSDAFFCSFHFDDEMFIVHNFAIRNIYNLQNIWHYFHGRFVTFLSLAFNYHFNGINVFGYHLFNLGVHVVSAILVWWLTLLTFLTPAMKEEKISRHANVISLFAGLIFVAHPIQTEAVTYIWQRAASMAAMFYLASLCFYIKSRLLCHSEPKGRRIIRYIYYFASLLSAMVAMFTKENAVTLPLMVLLYEFTFLTTKRSLDRSSFRTLVVTWKHILPFLLFIFIVPVTYLFIKSQTFQDMHGNLRVPGGVITPMHYFLTQFRVMFTYIRLVFLPFDQNIDHEYPVFKGIFEPQVLISLLSLITIFYLAIRLFSKYRLVSFSIFLFFLTLIIPESSFWAMGDVILEHRLYLPLAGYSIFLASSVYYLLGKNSIKTMVIILSLIIALNSVLTYQRNKVWRTDLALWDDAAQKSPHKARVFLNRGISYCKQGNLDQGMFDLNKSIAIDPDYPEAHTNLGVIYERHGDDHTALQEYTKAITLSSGYGMAYYNRGLLYDKLGFFAQAISDLTKFVEIAPHDPKAYSTRGVIYAEHGNLIQAIAEFDRALAVDPNYKEAYNDRVIVYSLLKKHDTKGS